MNESKGAAIYRRYASGSYQINAEEWAEMRRYLENESVGDKWITEFHDDTEVETPYLEITNGKISICVKETDMPEKNGELECGPFQVMERIKNTLNDFVGVKWYAGKKSGLWVQADKENLPTCEVLARNEKNVVLVGVLSPGNYDWQGNIYCIDDFETELHSVTHYITVENLLKL